MNVKQLYRQLKQPNNQIHAIWINRSDYKWLFSKVDLSKYVIEIYPYRRGVTTLNAMEYWLDKRMRQKVVEQYNFQTKWLSKFFKPTSIKSNKPTQSPA